MRRTDAPSRLGIALLALAVASFPLSADDSATPKRPSVTMDFRATGGALGTRAQGESLRAQVRGNRVRITSREAGYEGAEVLVDAESGQSMLISLSSGIAWPFRGIAPETFLRDSVAPCAERLRCVRGPDEFVAGRRTSVWNYRRADGLGPDGTDEGTVWIDGELDLVLAYRGRTSGRHGYKAMRAERVSIHELPEELFLVPGESPSSTADLPRATFDEDQVNR